MLLDLIKNIQKDILISAYRCGTSVHIGGSLSMVHLLASLYHNVLRANSADPFDEMRDIFILSKGHAALGLYSVLKNFNFISDNQLKTFQTNGSALIAHPIQNIELGIESSNGSLGQGLSYGAGIALSMLKKKQDRRVFVLLGDGECNEGAVWEAAMFASQYEIKNLIAIIDNNHYQNDGATSEVSDDSSLAARWAAFGWETHAVNGHSSTEIDAAFDAMLSNTNNKPKALIANTVKGYGVSFMENNNDWHHNRLTERNLNLALEELG